MDPIILPRISDQKPLVSVVSITYNHEPYIRDCLDGFLMQKTDFPVEIIIHDDASTDHTADIIREYHEKRPDLFHVIIEQKNIQSQGRSSLTETMMKAKGKYIALCEGDDYWTDPLKLQKQFDYMNANLDCSGCFHNTIVVNLRNNRKRELYKTSTSKELFLKDIIAGGGGLIPTASLFFRKVITSEYCRFREGCPVGDYPLAIYIAQHGRIHYNKAIMSVYRKYAINSWTRNNQQKDIQTITVKRMIEWIIRLKEVIQEDKAVDYVLSKYYFALFLLNDNKQKVSSLELYSKLSYYNKQKINVWIYIDRKKLFTKESLLYRFLRKFLLSNPMKSYDRCILQ